MNSDGSAKELLFDGFGTDPFPEFTPDGQTVVLEASTGDDDVGKIPATPAAPPLQVATPLAADNALHESAPSVSPDGTGVAFVQRSISVPCCPDDIYSVGINGGATVPIANSPTRREFSPAYSPDGTKIAYIADSTVLIANSDGSGTPVPLNIGAPISFGSLEWAPAPAAVPDPPPTSDTQPPDTTIVKGPKDKSKKKTATFEFSSSEPGSTFQCRLDGKPFTSCTSPLIEKVKKGKHSFEVRATDVAGNTDATPASDD